ncbi:MAG TPA: hypothetical protein VHS96_01710 [Bacteroidia bacterium]|nr:hypothetical protein [Bacteroidia bacterium]
MISNDPPMRVFTVTRPPHNNDIVSRAIEHKVMYLLTFCSEYWQRINYHTNYTAVFRPM